MSCIVIIIFIIWYRKNKIWDEISILNGKQGKYYQSLRGRENGDALLTKWKDLQSIVETFLALKDRYGWTLNRHPKTNSMARNVHVGLISVHASS